jgi:hypothetical protein
MIERDKSERRVNKPTEENAGDYPVPEASGTPADEDEKPEREVVHVAEPTLWVTDAELIRRIGVPAKIAREAIRTLDRNPNSGFPKKQALWGNRRYWATVRTWFDRTYGPGTLRR